MLSLEIAQLTDRGGRRNNEDACGHWHSERQLCCVLADGAGGHGGGDIAAQLAVRDLVDRFSQTPTDDGDALADALRRTNQALRAQRTPGTPRADMHSTAICLVIDAIDHRAHWAHAGDSRLYWFRGGRLLLRTRDHSLVQALVDAGLLADDQAQHHPKRSELHSALGLPPEQLVVSCDEGDGPVQPGDAFLLCSDGLWEPLDDAVLTACLVRAESARAWLEALGAAVQAATRAVPGHDNYTAVAVWAHAA
jgi:serine/threonine protein phosphatase PrpC